VRHALSQAIHRYFHEHGFVWVHTPIITASDAEGAGEMFRVSTLDVANADTLPRVPGGRTDFSHDFFGREAFLTVSGQLNVESYCLALSKVYTFGPTFRAENSNTSRHLAEFWMVEPEIAFADLAADADLAESFLKSIFTALLNERGDDMTFFADRIDKTCIDRVEHFVSSTFERLSYAEAIAALERSGKSFEFPVRWGIDLQSEHERWLTEEHVKAPVVVMNYPKEIKAFYMRMNDDGKTVAAMDVLAPGIGEIIGGSQREERLDYLDRRLAELHLDPQAYWWYRDLRRFGTVPHAGFGLGLERTIIYATGMANIRDVIPFPRTPGHAAFCFAGRESGRRRIRDHKSQMLQVSVDNERLFQPLPRLRRPLQDRERVAAAGDLEHQYAFVADLLRLHHRGLPVDAAGVGNQVFVLRPAIVVDVGRPEMA
jgi:asparaginyl-tRNA synthetase